MAALGTPNNPLARESNPLYVPSEPENSRIYRFLQHTNTNRHLSLASYEDLYNWSIDHTNLFWGDVWHDTDVVGHKGDHVVDPSALPPANPPWFKDAKLNWAENMLQCRASDKVALVEASMSLSSTLDRQFLWSIRSRTPAGH